MRTPTLALSALLLSAVLTGCGSDSDAGGSSGSESAGSSGKTGEDSSGTGSGSDGFDATTATLSDEGFCDELDVATLAQAVQSKKLEKRIDYAKGETYEDYTGKKTVAPSSWCLWSDNAVTDQGNTVSVQIAQGTEDDVAKSAESWREAGDKPDYDKTCEVSEETTYGDPGAVAVCTPKPGKKAGTLVAAFGLVSGVKFSCSGSMAKVADAAALESRVRAMCGAVLETLAD